MRQKRTLDRSLQVDVHLDQSELSEGLSAFKPILCSTGRQGRCIVPAMNGFTLKDYVAQEAIALEANLTLGGNFKIFAETGIAMFASTITSAGRSHLLFMAN